MKRTLGAAAVAAACTAVAPGAALAASVERSGANLVVTGGNEYNDLDVSDTADPNLIQVRDDPRSCGEPRIHCPGEGTLLQAGPGCTQVDARIAHCTRSGLELIVGTLAKGSFKFEGFPIAQGFANETAISSNVTGGPGNDLLTGGQRPNRLEGNGGDDVLVGGRFDDAMLGGEGDDTFQGGGAEPTDFLDNDVLEGGPGRDLLEGAFGSDTLSGGTGADTVSYEPRTTGVVASLDGKRNDGAGDLGSGIIEEDLIGEDVERLVGGKGSDKLTGNGRINRLDGREGNDVLRGLKGDDSLLASPGDDVFSGGPGRHDAVTYARASKPVIADIDGKPDDGEPGEKDRIGNSVETLIGGSGNDILDGNQKANGLLGGKGVDQLTGYGGDDRLFGFEGDDRLFGGPGRDVLNAGHGDDKLGSADGGYDRDRCGPGKDSVTYDNGVDEVIDCEHRTPVEPVAPPS